MEFEGNPAIFARLRQRKAALQDNRCCWHIRPVLLGLSGTNRGIYGGGQVTALERAGHTDSFVAVVGVSTGGPKVTYFVARQAALGTTIYVEECTDPQFINFSRGLLGGHYADIDWLVDGFAGDFAGKALDQIAVMQNPAELWLTVTDAFTGKGKLINAKLVRPSLLTAVKGTIAIPGLYRDTVLIPGHGRVIDGAFGMPFPTEAIIEQFNPTDILVLANRPRGHRDSVFTDLAFQFLTRNLPSQVRHAIKYRSELFQHGLATLRNLRDRNWGILWSDDEVGAYCRDSAILRAAADRSERHLAELLAG